VLSDQIIARCQRVHRYENEGCGSVAPFSVESVSMNLFELTMYEKQLVGSIFGSANPRRDIPRLLRLYQEGQLELDELVTRTYPIEEINDGYQAMRDGTNIRGRLIYDTRRDRPPAWG